MAFALRHRDRLVGFDIAGSEVGYPPSTYGDGIRPIRDAGMRLTAHYGESGPPAYVREAIEVLGPERLGHGLSTAWDESVTELVIRVGVTLEMCPTSNLLTRGVAKLEDHPARRLLDRGARVTINTDDPGLMGIDLTHEFEVARDALGFDENHFRRVTTNAIEACFLPDDVKADVRRRHFGWLDGSGRTPQVRPARG